MKTSLLNRLLGMIFSLAALAAMTLDSCANPAIGFIAPTAVASAHSLTLAWNSAEGYKSLRPTFPTPTSYDITLHPTTGPDVTQTAVATTSCTFANLAAVIYTATVNGKIGSNVVVTGTGSVNMTGAAAVTSTILLYYISSGAGTGQMHLTFSSATAVTGTPTLTLVDPAGVITNPTPTGTTPTFAHQNTSAVAGTWKMFSKFIAGTTTALKSDTILVLQGVDTIATVSIAASDFNATYLPVTSLTLSASTMSLNAGGATGSLTATLVPASPSNSLVAWTSTAPFSANVDQNGVVTPVAAGTATITATSVDKSTVFASCTVTVKATYSVTYDVNNANSGSAPVIQTKIAGTSLTLATNSGTLARTGYSFAGWNTLATGLGTDYAAGASYATDAALILYAKWTTLPTYAVSYNLNSATSGTVPGTQT